MEFLFELAAEPLAEIFCHWLDSGLHDVARWIRNLF